MNIILEGPDNCGKSTLARAIHEATGWPIKDKEGRPSTWEGMLDKIRKYQSVDGMIIDRHPIISQTIYGFLRSDPDIPIELMNEFYTHDDIIIYCRCHRGLQDHEASPTDTPQHLRMIEENQEMVRRLYDSWGCQAADIRYSQYDKMERVVAMVKGALDHERG